MSLVMKCDNCYRTSEFDEEFLLANGWEKQDYGHTCGDCSEELHNLEDLGDAQTTIDTMIQDLTKKSDQ